MNLEESTQKKGVVYRHRNIARAASHVPLEASSKSKGVKRKFHNNDTIASNPF